LQRPVHGVRQKKGRVNCVHGRERAIEDAEGAPHSFVRLAHFDVFSNDDNDAACVLVRTVVNSICLKDLQEEALTFWTRDIGEPGLL